MLEQMLHILETAASSEHAALLITLAIAVALAWGWWRRELAHLTRYDQLLGAQAGRENSLLECLRQREEEVDALSKEMLEVLRDVSAAMAGMERTLDGVEALVHTVLNERLHGKEDPSDGNK